MNIMFNNYCNLSCEYCFANKVLGEDKKELSLKDLQWLIDFSKKSEMHELRIIGGEPTLHSKFERMLLEVGKAKHITKIQLFTNANYDSRLNYFFNLIARDRELSILVNLNSPKTLTKTQWNNTMNNISELRVKSPNINVTIGINFYKENQDYQYIIDVAKKFNIRNIRYAITVPNTIDKKSTSIKKYFNKYKGTVIDFLKKCEFNKLKPSVDCNNIPLCLLSDSELRDIATLSYENLRPSVCDPVVDVQVDMKAIRCFAMSDYKVNIKDFNHIEDLKAHFRKKIDEPRSAPIFEACKTCNIYKKEGKSCACLAFTEKGGE